MGIIANTNSCLWLFRPMMTYLVVTRSYRKKWVVKQGGRNVVVTSES